MRSEKMRGRAFSLSRGESGYLIRGGGLIRLGLRVSDVSSSRLHRPPRGEKKAPTTQMLSWQLDQVLGTGLSWPGVVDRPFTVGDERVGQACRPLLRRRLSMQAFSSPLLLSTQSRSPLTRAGMAPYLDRPTMACRGANTYKYLRPSIVPFSVLDGLAFSHLPFPLRDAGKAFGI